MLVIDDLHVSYGEIRALKGISLYVDEKRIISLLGANGAGKSTTVRAVSGQELVRSGSIRFLDREIAGMPPHEIQRLGLVQIPEGRKIFANLTVRENLLMGAYNNKDHKAIADGAERVYSYFPILKKRLRQLGGTLSGGERQMLAVGRAMMSNPKLLMMDEPSLGLAPLVCRDVFSIIELIRSEGVTVFLIEQNAVAALNIADYAYVLETGRIVLKGTGKELLGNPRVKEYYLGERRPTAEQA